MPKVKAKPRPSRRRGPYRQESSAELARRLASPLLALPYELRQKVYDALLYIEPLTTADVKLPITSKQDLLDLPVSNPTQKQLEEIRAWKYGRKSLLRVCRQIYREWQPKFYDTTTFIVQARKVGVGNIGALYIALNAAFFRCNAADFSTFFLKTLNVQRLAQIKKIEYDTDLVGFESFFHFPWALKRHSRRLTSLEQVTLRANQERMMASYGMIRYSSTTNPSKVWSELKESNKWNEARDLLLGIGRRNHTVRRKARGAGILTGWKVSKRIEIEKIDARDQFIKVSAMSITFKKPDEPVEPVQLTLAEILNLKYPLEVVIRGSSFWV